MVAEVGWQARDRSDAGVELLTRAALRDSVCSLSGLALYSVLGDLSGSQTEGPESRGRGFDVGPAVGDNFRECQQNYVPYDMDCGSCVVTVLGDSGERWWNVDCVESKVCGHPGGPCRFSPGFLVLQVPGIVKVQVGTG